jgi:exopolysaccharide biosynthesis polyprenyl glycosylphosphotransferase
MLRRDRQIKMQLQQMLDACLFGGSFMLAWAIRSNAGLTNAFSWKVVTWSEPYIWLYVVLMVAGPLVLEAQGFYDRTVLSPRRTAVWPLFRGCVLTTVGLITVLYFFQLEQFPRWVAILFGFISFLLILAKEEAIRLMLRSKYAREQFTRRFVLVGTGEETTRMRDELRARPQDDLMILAEFDLNTRPVDELTQMLHEHSVNGVIVNARHNYFEKVEAAVRTCELEGVEVWLIADFFKTQISHTSFDDFHGRPVLVFRATPDTSWQSVLKQVIDFTVAFLVVVVLTPLLFIPVGLLIKLSSPGPILFRQRRCGLNGKPFTILKFRTMETDAEGRKHELAARNEMSGPVFKMKNDPRVTGIGKWLRKFSIDEFPQFYNVLRGEMSLVGPRPLPVDEVKRFDDLSHRRRLSVKPGLTCLWQVSGRNDVSNFRDWVRLDLEYIDNWSLWLDLKIMWRTIPIVLIGNGAR